MGKRIFLYRHAKSDWEASYGSDHERPLAKRGIKAAKLMGKLIANSGQIPELAITSSALRAKQTLELSILEGGWNTEVRVDSDLYYNSVDDIFEIIKSVTDKYSSAILVGHEPKTTSLCSLLIGGGDIAFPTASIARIDFYADSWSELKYGQGQLRWHQQPAFFLKGDFEI